MHIQLASLSGVRPHQAQDQKPLYSKRSWQMVVENAQDRGLDEVTAEATKYLFLFRGPFPSQIWEL